MDCQSIERLSVFPHQRITSVAPTKRWMLGRCGENELAIWRIGRDVLNDDAEVQAIETRENLLEDHEKVCSIEMPLERNITDATMSQDGNWLAVADTCTVGLFRLEANDDSQVTPRRVALDSKQLQLTKNPLFGGAHHLRFSVDGMYLFVACTDSTLAVVSLKDDDSTEIVKRFDQHRPKDKSGNGKAASAPATIIGMVASSDSVWLASWDCNHNVFVYDLADKKYKCRLPTQSQNIAAIRFKPNTALLYIVYADNSIQIFDVEQPKLVAAHSKQTGSLPESYLKMADVAVDIAFRPESQTEYAIWSSSWYCSVNEAATGTPAVEQSKSGKRKRSDSAVGTDGKPTEIQLPFKAKYLRQPAMCYDYLNANELVIHELSIADLLQSLPPSFCGLKYGQR